MHLLFLKQFHINMRFAFFRCILLHADFELQKIETEMQYPGQIKVTVIREMRAVSFAK